MGRRNAWVRCAAAVLRTPTLGTSAQRPWFARADAVLPAAGAVMTLSLVTLLAGGHTRPVEAIVALFVFAALTYGFIVVPWMMVPVAIPIFVALPALKFFVSTSLGGIKDAISFSALSAAAVLAVRRRAGREPARIDRPLLMLIGGLFLLFFVNLGGLLNQQEGSHGGPWYQGVRLFFEPLSLLLVGLTLREPARTLRAAKSAIVLSGVGTATFGIIQQVLGPVRLTQLGYQYSTQIRTIGGHVRSFGTLDDPFVYASFVLLAIATVVLSGRIRLAGLAALVILSLGLVSSYVRTAAIEVFVVLGITLAARRRPLVALLCILVAFAATGTTFVLASEQTSTRVVNVNPTTYLTLNGRTKLWRERIGNSGDWPFGQGVGATGTAAERAQKSLTGKIQVGTRLKGTTVDSGYLSVIADVGFLGLALFLALLGRLVVIAWRAVQSGAEEGWLAIGFVSILLIDAGSRESFTSYPMPYLGMLLAGLACASARSKMQSGTR
jgi:O-antigen ligase